MSWVVDRHKISDVIGVTLPGDPGVGSSSLFLYFGCRSFISPKGLRLCCGCLIVVCTQMKSAVTSHGIVNPTLGSNTINFWIYRCLHSEWGGKAEWMCHSTLVRIASFTGKYKITISVIKWASAFLIAVNQPLWCCNCWAAFKNALCYHLMCIFRRVILGRKTKSKLLFNHDKYKF